MRQPVICALILACAGALGAQQPAQPRPARPQPTAAQVQAPPEPAPMQVPPQCNIRDLIARAEAADSSEGSKAYAQQLAEWFLSGQAGDAYIDAFASRLSTADLMARQGKRELIPESAVAQAFNDLMSKVHAPLRTDANVVHQLRITLHAVSPSFSTVDSHTSTCLPGEAVHLMIQLLLHNGTLRNLCPPQPDATGRLVQHACPGKFNAEVAMTKYLLLHSRSQKEMLYNHVAKVFGM